MRKCIALIALSVSLACASGADPADSNVTVLHRFGDKAAHPGNLLAYGQDGLLYGVADPQNEATSHVFRVSAAGAIEDLGPLPQGSPRVFWTSPLTLGVDGKLWGSGDTDEQTGGGLVFTIATDGTIDTE